MFDFVRNHTKIIMGVLFVLIIPSFVLFGLDGYTSLNQGANRVAEVDGHPITQTEWDNAHRQEVDRIRAANPGLDVALLDTPAVKYASLERLVREQVLAAAARHEHLVTTDAALATALSQDASIAALRRADGTLDMERYRQLLAVQGLTPEGFEARVRADLTLRQTMDAVANSNLASTAQAEVAMDALLERREVRIVRFATPDYAAKVQVSDADLEAFYQANQARYQAPESAQVEYIVLDLEAVKKAVAVSEQDLRAYYDQNAATLGRPEERRASHILITAAKDAPAAERQQAKEKAEALLARLRQAPDSFAELARTSSQDEASAPGGGDLGFFQRNKGIDPSIGQATFGLAKPGDISALVESDFGYHIVRLTEVKPSAVPAFDKLRPQLEDQLRAQQAQKQFGEMAEAFTNGVYEQSDSLKPVADKLKLVVQSADKVTRLPAAGATGALANPKFLSALFSADAVDKKRNTAAIEVGPNQIASGRVVTHSPAHARPFAEVKSEVRAAYVAERGAALAREDGQARLKAWTEKPDTAANLPAAVVLARDATQGQPAALVEAVLRADPGKLPAFVGVDLGAQGFAVARVDKVLPRRQESAELVAQGRARYEQLWEPAEMRGYYELLKTRYKARILAPTPSLTAPAQ
jgi:peptidyl-prolyl cis-trans isomerase D